MFVTALACASLVGLLVLFELQGWTAWKLLTSAVMLIISMGLLSMWFNLHSGLDARNVRPLLLRYYESEAERIASVAFATSLGIDDEGVKVTFDREIIAIPWTDIIALYDRPQGWIFHTERHIILLLRRDQESPEGQAFVHHMHQHAARRARDERSKISAYLSQHDVPCPGCKYQLRGIAALKCPECARQLVCHDFPEAFAS